MASSVKIFLLFPLIFLIIDASVSHKPALPKAAIIPIAKDLATHQYVAAVSMGNPNPDPVELVLDLNGPHTWLHCGATDASPTSHLRIESSSLDCSMAKSTSDNCFGRRGEAERGGKFCSLQAENALTKTLASAELSEAVMKFEFRGGDDDAGSGSGPFAGHEQFLLLCASDPLLEGLARGAKGILGLGNSRISLPWQFPTKFGFLQRRFSLCLPSSSSSSNGAVTFGGKPHESISNSMTYTPLLPPTRNGLKRRHYYINVNSIAISGKKVPLPQKGSSLRTRLDTVTPYTILGSKIYRPFIDSYLKAAAFMNMTLLPPVAPFEACFGSKNDVPIIELVLQSEMVRWKVRGRNSMVRAGDGVMCLGFLNGGLGSVDSIVLGGYQMEDYVLDFDLGNSVLGFSLPLLLEDRSCSDLMGSHFSREFL